MTLAELCSRLVSINYLPLKGLLAWWFFFEGQGALLPHPALQMWLRDDLPGWAKGLLSLGLLFFF